MTDTNRSKSVRIRRETRSERSSRGELWLRPTYSEKSYKYSTDSQCLKIIEKVSLYMMSEASYVYILSGHNLSKNAEKN